MNVKVYNEDYITTVKTNAKHLGNYKFTYDNQLDILRVWVSTDFKEIEIEPLAGNVFVARENGKLVFIKILDFMKSFDFLNTYLPKDINDYLLNARSLLIGLKNENIMKVSEKMAKFVKLESGNYINVDSIITISANESFIIAHTIGFDNEWTAHTENLTKKDLDNILKVSETK